ncbi:MAG: hypothetical protein HRT88_23350 [Lentisphaeraceae bacterium]|nr:hypothetical protein [Lentisphaeraceae bacterium]
MIQLNLPIGHLFSLELKPVLNSSGGFDFGRIDVASGRDEVRQAQVNGGSVLYATSHLEGSVERVIASYFVRGHQYPANKRQLFENELLQSSAFNYSFKKKLLNSLMAEKDISFSGKNKTLINKHLTQIGRWRNMFAHGRVGWFQEKGVCIKYYERTNASKILNDDLWREIEEVFVECDRLITDLLESIERGNK